MIELGRSYFWRVPSIKGIIELRYGVAVSRNVKNNTITMQDNTGELHMVPEEVLMEGRR